MAPVILTGSDFRLDHQGKGTGPQHDDHRNAHKQIFHVTSLRASHDTPKLTSGLIIER